MVVARFPDVPKEGRDVVWNIGDFHQHLRPCYCSTTHKAQGETINEHTAVWAVAADAPQDAQHRAVA